MQKNQVSFMNSSFFQGSYTFKHPENLKEKARVFPVFIPFSGCPVRCIYCSQLEQTGSLERSVESTLNSLDLDFEKRQENKSAPLDLAFYGGTFTALPPRDQVKFLQRAAKWKEQGQILKIRCSTRPDTLDIQWLKELKNLGLDLIELGIQSFNTEVLLKSSRDYQGHTAIRACELVKEAGLALGIQLMQGLPGQSREICEDDLKKSILAEPDCIRLYPCLVFKNTALARLWEKKEYKPWGLEETIDFLAWACLQLWQSDIPIIRMGVAPEPAAVKNILDGPFHPSLGNMARSKALLSYIKTVFKKVSPKNKGLLLKVPLAYQGEFWGFKAELKEAYHNLGITKVEWVEGNEFVLDEIK